MNCFRFKDNQTQKKIKNKESVFNDIKNTTKTKTPYQFNEEIKDIDIKKIKQFDEQNNEIIEKQTGSSKYIEKLDNLKIKYKKDPKKFVILASSFLLLLSLIIGTSFAALTYLSQTANSTTIEAGTLALELKNESNQISFDGAIPQEDKEALENNSEYTFTIKNNGSIKSNYKVILENTCTLNKEYEINGEKVKPDKCIPNEYVKVGLKKDGEEYKVLEYDKEKNEYILETGMLSSNEEESYKMKVWLDYDTPNDYNSKGIYNIIYSAKLAIDYEQTVTEKVEVKYTVKYDANGGSGTMENTNFEAGEEKTLSKNTFTRNGYEFIGWALVNASNKVKYVDQEKVKNLTDKENETITLYAIWKANEYTITYYLGNGTSTAGTTAIGTSTCAYNGICKLSTWTNLGKTFPQSDNEWSFAGWSTNKTGTSVTHTDGKQFTYTTTENIDLYAVGSRTFKFHGGIPSTLMKEETQYWNPYSTSSTYATNINVPESTKIEGWEHYGYRANNTASSTAPIKTVGTHKESPTSLTNMSFRAIYKRDISVTYDKNGGTGVTEQTTGTQYYNAGMPSGGANTNKVSLTLAENGFSKQGYEFSKWTEKSTSGTAYDAGGTYSFSNQVTEPANVTMYAKWTGIEVDYKVEHYVMTTSGSYPTTATSTENKTGITDSSLTIENLKKTTSDYNKTNAIIYSHGTVDGNNKTTTTILADGSRVIKLYYKRTYGTLTTKAGTNVDSVTTQSKVKYYYGATVPTIEATLSSSAGYTYSFSKWASSNTTYLEDKKANPTGTFTWPAMPEGTEITLTASATKTANTYKITLNGNGATTDGTASVTATYDSNALSPASITLPQRKYTVSGFSANSTGATISSTSALTSTYTLKGWYTKTSSGSKVLSNIASPALQASVSGYTDTNSKWIKTGDATLYAQWTSQSVKLPSITKTGYTCTWNTKADGTGTSYNSGATITPTTNIELYARCTANQYAVEYYSYDGTTKYSSSSHEYGTPKNLTTSSTLSATAPNSNVTFYGWATSANSTTRTYTDGQSINNLTDVNGETIKLYAIWRSAEVKITYKSGVNSATSQTSDSYYYYNSSTSVSITTSTPADITNWTKLGWRDDTTAGTKEYSSNTSTNFSSSKTLYGVYSRSYTAKAYSGVSKGTTKEITSSTAYYNSNETSTPTTVSIDIPTAANTTDITNWTELGYRDDTTAGKSEHAFGTTKTVAWGKNFYAVYQRELSISYNGNSATSGSTEATKQTIYLNTNSTTTSSQEVTLESNGFTKTGYTFSKWAEGSASGTEYSEGASYTAGVAYNATTFGKTMYAKWNANEYTITYYLGNASSTAGTTSIGTSTCTYNDSCTLKTWETLGKTFPGSSNKWSFAGWTTSETGTNVTYTDGKQITYTTAGNINLYAIGSRTFKFYSGTNGSLIYSEPQYWNPYSTSATYATSIDVPTATAIDGWEYYGYRANNTASSTATIKTAETYKGGTTSLTSMDFRTIYSRDISVTYNANGGTGTTTETTGTQYFNSGMTGSGANTNEVSLTLASNGFTKSGYSFTKWTEGSTSGTEYSAGGTYSFDNEVTESANVTMYAKWTINNYTVNVEVENGTVSPASKTINYNNTGTFTVNPSTGYGRPTVSCTASQTATISGTTLTTGKITNNTTCTVTYIANTYTVTYDYSTNGGTSATKTSASVNYGSSIDMTPTATKSGWEFVGWNTNKNATSKLTSLKMSTSNVTLYAIYKKTATATFYYYDGSAQTSTTSNCTMNNTDTSCSFSVPSIVSNSKGPSNATYYGISTSLDNTSTTTSYPNATTKYYAVYYKTKDLFITYYDSESQVLKSHSLPSTEFATTNGTTYSLKTADISIPSDITSGKGPYETSYVGVSTSINSMTTVTPTTENTTYYAIYRSNVTLYRPTSTTAASSITVYRNSFASSNTEYGTVLATSNTGTSSMTSVSGLTGTLKGFSSAVNSTSTSYSSISALKNSTATTAYALSTRSITISYNANGGEGAPSSQTTTRTIYCKSTSTATITGNTTISSTKPTRTGYTFNKWNTASDGSGTNYNSGTSYNIGSSVTLYAQWTIKTYTVNLTVLNGTISGEASQTVEYGKNVTFTTTPASSHYDLAAYACTGGKVPTFTNNTTLSVTNITQNTNCTVEYHKSAAQELIEKSGTATNQPVEINQPATDTTPALTEYRYMGKGPYNYLQLVIYSESGVDSYLNYEDVSYRIMGVFYTEDENGNYSYRLKVTKNKPMYSHPNPRKIETTSSGINYYIVNEMPLSWDTSSSGINSGYGSNQWGESGNYKGAALMRLLNPGYENEAVNNSLFVSQTDPVGNCYVGQNQATSQCDYYDMLPNYKYYIDTVKWYLGAADYRIDTPTTYKQERGTTVGDADSGQSITKTNTWIGKVGLPYASDYGYASSSCYNNGTYLYGANATDYRKSECINTNWIYRASETTSTWLMTPDIGETYAGYPSGSNVKTISFGVGCVSAKPAGMANLIRPTFHLIPEVMFDYSTSDNTGYTTIDTIYKLTDISEFQEALENSMS